MTNIEIQILKEKVLLWKDVVTMCNEILVLCYVKRDVRGKKRDKVVKIIKKWEFDELHFIDPA